MANTITWETEMKKALAQSRAQDKQVLLDFFNPG